VPLFVTGTLHGIESKSNYHNYKPTGDYREQNMDNRWLKKIHKNIMQKRADQEVKKIIADWGSAKSNM
jgi:hypothetical protein